MHFKQVYLEPRPSALNITLPAIATKRGCLQLSIDISFPLGALQQTRRTPLLLSIDGTYRQTDRQTDGRTPDRYIVLRISCGQRQ